MKNKVQSSLDISASIWAGLIAGAVLFLMYLFVLPYFDGGDTSIYLKLLASPLLGSSILISSATEGYARVLISAIAVHFLTSIVFSLILAAMIHRWGIIVATLSGAVFGLCIYAINFYSLSYFFPWMYGMHGTAVMCFHIIFGALSGFIYELLEEEPQTMTVSGGQA